MKIKNQSKLEKLFYKGKVSLSMISRQKELKRNKMRVLLIKSKKMIFRRIKN